MTEITLNQRTAADKKGENKMTDEEKIYLQELNYTFADGFTRGYNRGFLDGLGVAAQVRVELAEQLKKEEKFND